MSCEELVSKYIESAECVMQDLKTTQVAVNADAEDIEKVIKHAKAYLDDAKYYRDKKRFEVGLTSIAYCEGLLDALKLLGAVSFEWPTKAKKKRK
jgi:FAD synthetase